MPRGYDRPLYIQPFDHRGSFRTKMFGWQSPLTDAQTAEIADAKKVIYDGFLAALASGVPKERVGILVDEQFGAVILPDAASKNIVTACPAEKSGQAEFEFEYGEDFARHIEAFAPSFCKVLVRYNPEDDYALNTRRTARLKRLSDFLAGGNRSQFLFALLVPAEEAELAAPNGDKAAYNCELRPRLIVKAIQELQDSGVEPDLWKVQGLGRREDCEKVAAAARSGGRERVSCIILGGGEDEQKVRDWLSIAADVPGFVGFAVGRAVFWNPLVAWRAKKLTREQAVAEIAARYREFVDVFEGQRARSARSLSNPVAVDQLLHGELTCS
jgi:myo-inositol catabolism protein IolC